MKTFIPKLKAEEKKWYLVDVAGKSTGKAAVEIANILRGKSKPTFTAHLDIGDYVVVTNCDKVVFTGNKMQTKKYYSHSRYAKDGLKEITAEKKMEKDPTFILKNAVAGMIPNNKLKKEILMKLKLFTGDTHTHEAQKPTKLEI